ncbi:MAG: hypothetical protein EHM93_12810 [Bacteroidales bacterium]|nr:MAG: hypothetical protein EHM93_12810 [Bacteroidales bacterium]
MKKTISTLAISVFIGVAIITSCQSSANKVENAQDKVQDAKEKVTSAKSDLIMAQQDFNAENQKFKKESDEKIQAHEKSIAEFKARIASEKKEIQGKYEMELAVLEQKNSDLKKKLDGFKEEGKDKWDKFKAEFNRDMDELGNAFRNLTVKNEKK